MTMLSPPPRLFPRMGEHPKCSSSHLFIWDAMVLVGRAKFGADWTGGELEVLDWPVSPNAAREEKAKQAKREAARPKFRPAAKVGQQSTAVAAPVPGFASSALANLQEDYSSHVWAWRAHHYRERQQVEWEANRSALSRLRETARWLHDQFRNSFISTFARKVAKPGEPITLSASEWYCENAFKTRFVAGRYETWLPRMSHPTLVYIFVDREGLERAISTLAHAEVFMGAADLAKCSAPLRFAVAFSLKHSAELAGYWKRPSLEAAITEEWDKANPDEPMLPVAATRIGYVIYPPDADATAQGQKGGIARKRV